MADFKCAVCGLRLCQQSPQSADSEGASGLLPVHLQDAKGLVAYCGHTYHVDCYEKLGSKDKPGRECRICSQVADMERANALIWDEEISAVASTSPPNTQDGTPSDSTSTIIGWLMRSAAAAAASESTEEDATPLSTQSGSGAVNATKKGSTGSPGGGGPRPTVMQLFLLKFPNLAPYLSAEDINDLDYHIDAILWILNRDGILNPLKTHANQVIQRIIATIKRRPELIADERAATQMVVDFMVDLFLATRPAKFRLLALHIPGLLDYTVRWWWDNFL